MEAKNSPEATREVLCRICSQSNIDTRLEAKRLSGHIGGKHSKDGWTKAKYVEQFGAEDFWHPEPPQNQKNKNAQHMRDINSERAQSRSTEGVLGAIDKLVADNLDHLTEDERSFYDQFFEQIVQQTDRDETQMPVISALAFDMIYVARLREKQLVGTSKGKPFKEQAAYLLASKELEDAVKKIEDRINKAMTSLGISREAQLKRGQAIKSTPAMILSGYLDEVERNSVEQLDAWRLEETRLYSTMLTRIDEFILSQAPDLEQDSEDDATDDGKPLSLRDALSKAGIATGGKPAAVEPEPEPEPVPIAKVEINSSDDDELPF